MQNRGISFSLDARSNNPLSPGRKPFHTLNPALAAFSDGRVMPYGTMGGDGHAGALMRDARGRVEAALDPRAGVVRRAVVERTRQLRLTWLTV
jgi:gamma-glutamyltranspeptidase